MKKNEDGQILVIVLIVFATIMILGTGLLSLTAQSHTQSIRSVNEQQAYNVAKSTLDIFLGYFEDCPENASKLIPDPTLGVGGVVTSSVMKFKDAHGQEWESELEINKVSTNRFRLTARTRGTGQNSTVTEEISAVLEGDNNILGSTYTQSIKIDGSAVDMKNGSIFSNGDISITNMARFDYTQGLQLSKVEAMGNLTMKGNSLKVSIGEIHVGSSTVPSGGMFLLEANPFTTGSNIGEIKLYKDMASFNKIGNSIMNPPSIIPDKVLTDPTAFPMQDDISPINSGGIRTNVDAPSGTTPDSHLSDKAMTFQGNVKFTHTGTPIGWVEGGNVSGDVIYGPMMEATKHEIEITTTGKTVEINNQYGGIRNLDIYNPGGTVIFRDCGGIAPIEFKGRIVAKEIIIGNCQGITFDFNSSSGSSSYSQYKLIKYEQ